MLKEKKNNSRAETSGYFQYQLVKCIKSKKKKCPSQVLRIQDTILKCLVLFNQPVQNPNPSVYNDIKQQQNLTFRLYYLVLKQNRRSWTNSSLDI